MLPLSASKQLVFLAVVGSICVSSVDSSVVQLAVGEYHACARLEDGSVKCWGFGEEGRLGYGNDAAVGDGQSEMGLNLPRVDLGAGRTALDISVGHRHSCVILDDETLKCWGRNAFGQLGYGDKVSRGDGPGELGDTLAVVDLGTGRTVKQVSAGIEHTCALLDDSTVKCWGRANEGQLGYGNRNDLGDGPGEMGDVLQAVDLETGRTAKQIAAGGVQTCAILDTDQVKCWGAGFVGRLGYGNQNYLGDGPGEMGNNLPNVDLGTGRTAKKITSGDAHICVILDDDRLKCWGYGAFGQLGYGDANNRGDGPGEMGDLLPFVDLGTGRTAKQVVSLEHHTCAVLDNDSVKCWGRGTNGRLGYGNLNHIGDNLGEMGNNLQPVDLGTGRKALQIATGADFTCALLDDNTVKCWGMGANGRLGYGDTDTRGDEPGEMGDSLLPVEIEDSLCGEPTSLLVTSLRDTSFGCKTIPDQVGFLVNLTKIDLSNAAFGGTIPTTLGNLLEMEELFLNGNSIGGTIPTQLGRLSKLQALHLIDNNLNGIIPTEIGLLHQLTALTLARNTLIQDLPSQIGQLTNLKQLHVAQEEPLSFIPSSLGRLNKLQGLDLGEVCDCRVPAILDTLTGLSGTAKAQAATCNDEPTVTLTTGAEVPCSPVRVDPNVTTTETSALVLWTYSNDTEIDQFASAFDLSGFPGKLYRSAVDEFIQTNSSQLSTSDAEDLLKRCETVFLSDDGEEAVTNVWAFQLLLTNSRATESTTQCLFRHEITQVSLPGFDEQYQYSLAIEPGETYRLRARPVVLRFAKGSVVDFRLGPLSNEVEVKAKDDIPASPVVGLSAESREEDRLSLQWSPPVRANGVIVRYVLIIEQLLPLPGNQQPNITRDTPKESFQERGLLLDTTYKITVYAETNKGRGPSDTITIATCPENMRTLDGDPTRCVAKRGFFLDRYRTKAVACSSLGEKVDLEDCLLDNLVVNDLKVVSGFWRPSLSSFDIRKCPLGSTACSGGGGGSNASLCQPNYKGPLCAVCADGYFMNGVECDKCTTPNLNSFMPVIFAAVAVFIALLATFCFLRGFFSWPNGKLAVKLKVLFTTYQIVGTFTWTLGTVFPLLFTEVASYLLFLNVDFTDAIPSFACLYGSDYFIELCFVTGFPVLLVILIIIYWTVARQITADENTRRKIYTRSIQGIILVTFLVFTPVSSKIFRALRDCVEFEDIGSYMPEDYTVVCGSTEYENVRAVAWTAVAVYGFGTFGFYLVLLCRNRRDIQRQCELVDLGDKRTLQAEEELEALNTKLQSVSFLFKSYCYWWWELVELVRKVVLGGVIALIEPGSVEQSIVLMLLALGSTVLYHQFLPFRHENRLGLVASYTVFFAAFASLLLKVREDFLVSKVFDVLLLLIVLSPIFFALILSDSLFSSVDKCCCTDERKSGIRAVSVFLSDELGRSSLQTLQLEKGEEEAMPFQNSKNQAVPLKAKQSKIKEIL